MATALWVRTIRHHRTDRQATVPCTRNDAHGALLEACRELDLPEPIWLDKNEREWQEFGMTRFLPDAFFRSEKEKQRSPERILTGTEGHKDERKS